MKTGEERRGIERKRRGRRPSAIIKESSTLPKVEVHLRKNVFQHKASNDPEMRLFHYTPDEVDGLAAYKFLLGYIMSVLGYFLQVLIATPLSPLFGT